MFKVFGEKTEQIIDRDAERVVVVALGEQGFGPQVRGTKVSSWQVTLATSQAGVRCWQLQQYNTWPCHCKQAGRQAYMQFIDVTQYAPTAVTHSWVHQLRA
eukprot:GHRQ01008395.1.p4 GENE.GHRQ01008395.1~~GHRQ01008395.1.p4  ORF type:complete len:101 (-),score=23.75 GHRQ01008395.1:2084-2386(-)